MLTELAVRDLGVVEDLSLVLGPGLTAVTGETGAGKTLIVEAIDLLLGGRADATMVRPGADEATVEARLVVGDEERVLRRVVPRDGRSRAYLDGGLATAGALAEVGARLIEIHGQHDHQRLFSPSAQRGALDRYGVVDLEPWERARKELAAIEEALGAVGGDERARARELDLLRFQLAELDAAGLDDPDEDAALSAEEDLLSRAVAHREAAAAAVAALAADEGAVDLLSRAVGHLDGPDVFAGTVGRLRALHAETADVLGALRHLAESIEEDPARLDEIRVRRALLSDLRRKYGATIGEVMAERDRLAARADELASATERGEELEARRAEAVAALAAAEADLGAARREAAPRLARATTAILRTLALPQAKIEVGVGEDPGSEIAFAISTNPGSPPLPLARIASGGELARTMLALRLVLTEAPDTLLFDEVDAGIGGEAAVAVASALAELGTRHQVLVVTHLPQVAARANAQIVVRKRQTRTRTVISAGRVEGEDRIEELARMLSGSPGSSSARAHARELLGS